MVVGCGMSCGFQVGHNNVLSAGIASVGYTHVSLDCGIRVVAVAWYGVVGRGISCSRRLRQGVCFIGTC